MPIVPIEYIEVDERGVAKLVGSRIKVEHLVEYRMGQGGTPEEIQAAFPHLTLAQVYAAFAYYYDHKDAMDARIEAGYQEYLRLREAAADSPFMQKLREVKRARESGTLHG
jgi:uncharacterized protein (DUF433 family)